MKDIFGKALLDYCNKQYTEDLITATSISSEDILPLPYLFRSYDDMPKLEQKALAMCQGKILDVGCGAGSHSLWLAENKFQITSIDISEGAIEVCKQRKIPNPQRKSLLEVRDKFDSIVILGKSPLSPILSTKPPVTNSYPNSSHSSIISQVGLEYNCNSSSSATTHQSSGFNNLVSL